MNAKLRKGIIIAAFAFPLAFSGRIAWIKLHEYRIARHVELWRVGSWPAEKELTVEKVKEGQTVVQTPGAVTIDLRPYINAKLTEAPMCPKGNNANNLAELPAGTNIYAGIPFDVEGSIQLMGGWLQHYGKKFPSKVDSIPIHRKCSKICLLHGCGSVNKPELFGINRNDIDKAKVGSFFPGEGSVNMEQLDAYIASIKKGTNVAVSYLLIHYEDGSTREINMVVGQQVFDWWWPTFVTGLPKILRTPAPGTELGWVGSNPYMRQWMPDASLSLFRTVFENPQPEVAISTLDYISNKTIACPFLVGLTVE
jgi:hypothetical protein